MLTLTLKCKNKHCNIFFVKYMFRHRLNRKYIKKCNISNCFFFKFELISDVKDLLSEGKNINYSTK